MKDTKLLMLLLAGLSFLFLLFFYQDLILHPNSYVINFSKDAIKNYYTFAYHVKHGGALTEFKGMNYPYGEHFLYTDCHPLFAVILKELNSFFPTLADYSIGILNFILLFAFVITVSIVFLVLAKLKVRNWLAISGALGISIFAPQIFRIESHFALSYSFFIPLTLLLLLNFFESDNKLKWSFYLLINNTGWFFIHAYLGMISVTLIIFTWLVWTGFNYKIIYKNVKNYKYLFIHALLPVIIFRVFLFLTDHHIGRDSYTEGFLDYKAHFTTVFLPFSKPFLPLIQQYFIIEEQAWEGRAYIGLASIIAIIICLVLLLFRKWRNLFANNFIKNKTGKYFLIIFLAGILVLFLSMGMPFIFGLENLLNWFPAIKQFRGIGRFAWVFYFTVTIGSIYFVHILACYLEKQNKSWLGLILMLTIPMLYFYEGISYHQIIAGNFTKQPNFFYPSSANVYSELCKKIDPDKYQAIISLPFYYIGSDNFATAATGKSYRYSQLVSYHTGLPILGAYLTRTGLNEAKNIMQAISPGYYTKQVMKDITDTRPFLLLFTKDTIDQYEQILLEDATKIYSGDSTDLYALSYDKLFEDKSINEIKAFEKRQPTLKSNKGFFVSDTAGFFTYTAFENKPCKVFYRAPGAFQGPKKEYNILLETKPGEIDTIQEYTVSFWMYNKGEAKSQSLLNSLAVVQETNKNGKLEWIKTDNPRNSTVIDGDWSLIEMKFKAKQPQSKIAVFVKGNDNFNDIIYMDDLIIRPVNTDVYRVEKTVKGKVTELFKNNHRIILKP